MGSAAEGGMRAADVHLPAVHAKHPQPEVGLAGQFFGGEGPGTTLWTERSGRNALGRCLARTADWTRARCQLLDRLLVGAWGHGGLKDLRAQPVVPLQVA